MTQAAVRREYETIYILRPDTGRETTEDVAGRVATVINAAGRMTRVENWGRRKLAYEVARHKRGVYVYLKYLGEGTVVSEVERTLRLQESVLKYHTVKLGLVESSVAVNDDDVRFEHVEELDDDPDKTLAEELGLVQKRSSHRDQDDEASSGKSDSAKSDSGTAKTESSAESEKTDAPAAAAKEEAPAPEKAKDES